MGWQSRKRVEKEKELERVLTKEEKQELKKEHLKRKKEIKEEINRPIENIEQRIEKSNINLLFISFRPILFITIGLFVMLLKQDYTFNANKKLWPISFFVVNILTIFLLIPLMRMQRISIKNVFKYKEKSFKWWQYVLIVIGFLFISVIGTVLSELIIYGTFMEKTKLMIVSYSKILDYFLLILLPLSTILAEDFFFFGYLSNTVKNNPTNYALICIFAIVQHAFFPFSFDLVFMGYRILSTLLLFIAYILFYKKTKNLIPIIISHTIFNLITMISIVML